jgi:hypothetical protein
MSTLKTMPALANDGFAVQEPTTGTSLIIGKIVRFTDGHFVVDKTEKLAADVQLVAVSATTLWMRWKDGLPAQHRITQAGQQHPDRDDLPDNDVSLWEPGLDGKPSDPWRDTRYLRLVDPKTGADYTFITDSIGGRRAVSELKSQIGNVRSAHPKAVPIVRLVAVDMKTKFGTKKRPSFVVVDWRYTAPAAAPSRANHSDEIDDLPFIDRSKLDDEIPF